MKPKGKKKYSKNKVRAHEADPILEHKTTGIDANPNNISHDKKEQEESKDNDKTTGTRWRWDKLIEICQLLGTIGLFIYAVQQNRAAQDSSKAAIKAVETVEKQFQIENAPFLVIKEIVKIGFSPNRPVEVFYNVVNLGKYPTRTISSIVHWSIADKDANDSTIVSHNMDSFNKFPGKFEKARNLYIHDLPITAHQQLTENVSENRYQFVKDGRGYLCLGIEIAYQNLINADTVQLTYIAKVISFEPLLAEIIYMNNATINK